MGKEIIMVCENDKSHNVVDEEKSNENWRVYFNQCPECGGEIVIPMDSI